MQLRQSYDRDGYAFPLAFMSPGRAAEHRASFESVEATYARDAEARRIVTGFASVVLPFVDEIMRLPSILSPVKEILGDDLLVMGANFFVKEPKSPAFVSWHQDLTYWGYEGASEVTAWVALTEATASNGCMRFIPGSHQREIVGHHDTFADLNMLSRGQEVAVDVNEEEAVEAALQPGEMSLHHGHLFHASSPNTSSGRRIGLVLRYVTPSMKQQSGPAPFAHLVAGRDRFGHFELLNPAESVMSASDVDNARVALARQERVGYAGAVGRGKRATEGPTGDPSGEHDQT